MPGFSRFPLITAVVTALLIPVSSHASVFVSGPLEGNSWSINFDQLTSEIWNGNLVGPYDYVRADYVSGATFEAPLFQNMTNGWGAGAAGNTSTFSWATGPSVDFNFDVVFNDPIQNTTIDYFVYDGQTLKQAQRLTVGAAGFISVSDLTSGPGRLEPIPEPASLALLGLGLVPLLRRRARKKQ